MNERTDKPNRSKRTAAFPSTRLRGVLAMVAAAVLLAGCQEQSADTVKQLDQARADLAAKRYAQCERTLDPIISKYNKELHTATALYMRAQCRMMTDRRREAQRDLTTAMPLASDKLLRGYIDAQLGNLAFEDGSYSQAAMHYEDALDKLPDEPPVDRVLYQYGIALQRLGRFNDGRKRLEEVYTKFPTSEHAVSAKRKHDWDGDYFSVQCGVFSRIALAHQAAARLRQDGINALAVPEEGGGSRRYVVRAGRYSTYAEANRELARVQRQQPDAFVVP